MARKGGYSDSKYMAALRNAPSTSPFIWGYQ